MINTLIKFRPNTKFLRDSQAVHRTLAHVLDGAPHQWSLPGGNTLAVRHPHPVEWDEHFTDRTIRSIFSTHMAVPITGTPVYWCLTANPTIAKSQGHGKRGKRMALLPEKNHEWVEKKLGQALNLKTIEDTALPPSVGKKPSSRVVHHRVFFEGTGTVRNQSELEELLTTGVGRGKAYGCGMLAIRKAGSTL